MRHRQYAWGEMALENNLTKTDVMRELFGIVSEKSKMAGWYYLFDVHRPITAREFYCFVYREVESLLDSILDGDEESKEYIQEYKHPREIAEVLVADIEHEYIERQIVAES